MASERSHRPYEPTDRNFDIDGVSQPMENSMASCVSDNQKWLIISGCQAIGLGQSLALICSDLSVETYDMWTLKREPKRIQQTLRTFSRIIVSIEVYADRESVDLRSVPNVSIVPHIVFGGYHPDLCYVSHNNCVLVPSPIGDYHSLIAVAAFKSGLTEYQALELYSKRTYEEIGYFAAWQREKLAMLGYFSSVGIDMSADFYRWVRNGCFMHSLNHPKIGPLYDLAVRFMEAIPNMRTFGADITPPDCLAVAPGYPVFPEIAERFGADNGSYRFKGADRVYSLEDFIFSSFAKYREYSPEYLDIKTHTYDGERALRFIRSIV